MGIVADLAAAVQAKTIGGGEAVIAVSKALGVEQSQAIKILQDQMKSPATSSNSSSGPGWSSSMGKYSVAGELEAKRLGNFNQWMAYLKGDPNWRQVPLDKVISPGPPDTPPPNPNRKPEDIITDLKSGKIDRAKALTELTGWYTAQNIKPDRAGEFANTHLNDAGFPGTAGGTGRKSYIERQRGFQDVARRFSMGTGIGSSLRDYIEDVAGRQILPFILSEAKSSNEAPFHQRVQTPEVFEQFLRTEMNSPEEFFNPRNIGNALRRVPPFLGISFMPGSSGVAGQETLRNILQGPKGSVGSELFGPTINLATEDTGLRLFPEIGKAARGATADAITTMLAQNPGQFTDVGAFIEYLAANGII